MQNFCPVETLRDWLLLYFEDTFKNLSEMDRGTGRWEDERHRGGARGKRKKREGKGRKRNRKSHKLVKFTVNAGPSWPLGPSLAMHIHSLLSSLLLSAR